MSKYKVPVLVSSFVYRNRRPFHPSRLWDVLNREPIEQVLRSTGLIWLATRMEMAGLWSQAGQCCQLGPAGFWWAAAPLQAWPDNLDDIAMINDLFTGEYGDRRQELVFIGQDLDRIVLESVLESCVLTDEEMAMGPEAWSQMDDPWSAWDPEVLDESQSGEDDTTNVLDSSKS
jgi:G3E family GTPase